MQRVTHALSLSAHPHTGMLIARAASQQLPEDMRKSPGRLRIEAHEEGEEIRWRKRHTLAGSWHRNQRRRQRCMRHLMLRRCSRCGKHRAPACRHGAQRRVDQMQPPRFRHLLHDVPTTRYCNRDRGRWSGSARRHASCPRLPMTQLGAAFGSNHGRAAPVQRSAAWPRRRTLAP